MKKTYLLKINKFRDLNTKKIKLRINPQKISKN